MEVNIFANLGSWKKKEHLISVKTSEIYDAVNALNEKSRSRHWVFPAHINPADYAILEAMEKVALRHIKHYHNDFYICDTQQYFNYSQKGLWLLRESGTNFIPLGQPIDEGKERNKFSERNLDIYHYYLKNNDFFYLVDHQNVKALTKQEASALIHTEMNKIKKA